MKPRALFELIILGAIWGASFLFLRVASPAVGPVGVAACRVTAGALMLLPLVALRRDLPAIWRHAPQLAGAALLANIAPFIGLAQAARSLPAGWLSILNATTPMWGALIGWLWAGEKLPAVRGWGLATGFVGVALLAADKTQLSMQGAPWAAALALSATLMYAFAVHYSNRYLSGLSPLANSAGTLMMGAVMLMLPAWWIGPQPMRTQSHIHAWLDVPAGAWLALMGLSLLCTGLAYLMFYRLIERIGASRALTVTFLIPVFGMLWGTLFLDERVTPVMLLSTGVILLGTWLSNQGTVLPAADLKAARS